MFIDKQKIRTYNIHNVAYPKLRCSFWYALLFYKKDLATRKYLSYRITKFLSHCGGYEICRKATRRRRRILQSRILCSLIGNTVLL